MVCPDGNILKRPTDAEAAMCLGITPELDPQDDLRRGGGRRRPCRSCRRGLRRVGRLVGDRARPARLWRAGGRLRPHRKLSRLSHRHFRPGAGRPRLHAGAEIRRRDRHSARSGASSIAAARNRATSRFRLEIADGEVVQARTVVDRLRRALSPAGHCQSLGLRRRRRLLLGVADRGQAVRGRGGGADRRRQFGGAGGGVSRAAGSSACISSRAAGSRRRCRAI